MKTVKDIGGGIFSIKFKSIPVSQVYPFNMDKIYTVGFCQQYMHNSNIDIKGQLFYADSVSYTLLFHIYYFLLYPNQGFLACGSMTFLPTDYIYTHISSFGELWTLCY